MIDSQPPSLPASQPPSLPASQPPSLPDSRPPGLPASRPPGLPASRTEGLHERLDAIYTPLEVAVEELHNRRLRFGGRTPGHDWLPDDLPEHPKGRAFLARFFATPNYETRHFINLATQWDLLPVIEEYHGDKFVAHNPIKRALARLGFHNGHDRHMRPLVEFASILDWSQQGLLMCDVRTHWGQSLLDFHRELFDLAMDGAPRPFLYECTPQYARAGCTPKAYYHVFLRVCVADGILFEDFLLDQNELPFTRDVVLSSFDAVVAETGLRPLIVRLSSQEEQTAPHWFWYPGELKSEVTGRIQGAIK